MGQGGLGRQREPVLAVHSAAGNLGAGVTLCKVGWKIELGDTGHVP